MNSSIARPFLVAALAVAVSATVATASAEAGKDVFQDDMSSMEAWTSIDGSPPVPGPDERVDHAPVMQLRNGLASASLSQPIDASGPWMLRAKLLHTKYKRGGWLALTDAGGKRGIAVHVVSALANSFGGSGWIVIRAWDQQEPLRRWTRSRRPGEALTELTATGHDPEGDGRGALTPPYMALELEHDPDENRLFLRVDGEVRAETQWTGFDDATLFEQVMVSGNSVMYIDDVKVSGSPVPAAAEDEKVVEPVVRSISDFGARGDGTQNDREAFSDALDEMAAIIGPKVLDIPAGTYLLRPPDDASNARGHVVLGNQKNLTLRGEPGTLLVMQSAFHHGILVAGCENVRLESLTVDYDPVPFTQGTIVEVDPEASRFVLALDDGFPRISAPHMSAEKTKHRVYLYRPGTTLKLNEYYDQYVEGIEPLDDNRVRVTSRNPVLPEFVGLRGAMVARRKADAVRFTGSRLCTADNVVVHSAPGLGFGLQNTDRIRLERCRIRQRPGTGRLMSTNADGIHVKWGRRGPHVVDCWLQGMGDDSVNIGGTYQAVLARPDAHTLIVDIHGSLRGEREMMLVRNETGTMIPLGESPWLDVVNWDGRRGMKLTFTDELPAIERVVGAVDRKQADMVINLKQVAANPVIRNNFFGRHRQRGVLMRAPGAVIEGNRFEDLLGPGIRLGHHYGGRIEGPNGSGAVIRDNTFVNVRRSNIQLADAGPDADSAKPQLSIQNVRIVDNRFSLYGQPSAHGHALPGNVIWIDNARNVDIDRNFIDSAHPNAVSAPLVVVNQAEDVTISGTVVKGRAADASEWLKITDEPQQDTIRVDP